MSNAFFGGFAIKLGLAGVGKAEVQGNGENQEFPGELPLWRPGEVFLVRGHRWKIWILDLAKKFLSTVVFL